MEIKILKKKIDSRNIFYYTYVDANKKRHKKMCKGCKSLKAAKEFVSKLRVDDLEQYKIKNIAADMFIVGSMHHKRMESFGKHNSINTINSNMYAYWDSASASVNGYSYGQVNACMETKTASEAVYEAMVVPGEINPTEFITIVIGSSTYKYTAPSSPTKTLLPGKIYTYNITVGS